MSYDTKNENESRLLPLLVTELNLWIMAFFAYVGVQGLNGMSILRSTRYIILNLVLLYCIYKFFYVITGRLWLCFTLSGIIWYSLGIVNHYVGEFRGVMFLPWDILAIKTAADVAGTYEYRLYPQAVLWLLFIIITAVFAYRLSTPILKGKKRLAYGTLSLAICAALMFLMVNSDRYREIPDRLYLIERYYRNQGIPVTFFHYSKFLFLDRPEGYSAEQCRAIYEKYAAAEDSGTGTQAQNIIVIMNEAFADFSVLGDLPEVKSALPFCSTLEENTVRGNLYVPVFGGTTVNTEYEFLTGNSIAFLKGCPFSYAVRTPRPSIAGVLKNEGYSCTAMHPATGVNWNRQKVYPLLGFDRFYSIEDYEGEDIPLINEHPTDDWDYSKVISAYENRTGDKFFMFNVTMQNHSGYEFDFKKETGEYPGNLSAYGSYPQGENYLALLKKSDEAFEKLTDYFSKVDEPTVIAIFGDHQPRLEDDFSSLVYSQSHDEAFDENDPVDNIRKYTTPFIIWANYDIEEDRYEMLSSNYLAGLVLRTAGCPLTPYQKLLAAMEEKYPVFSVNGAFDKNGTFYSADSLESDPLVMEYRFMEYNNAGEKNELMTEEAFTSP